MPLPNSLAVAIAYSIWDEQIPAGLTLLDHTDFESGFGATNDPFGQGRTALTTNNPASGTQCLRFNLNGNVTDPITGLLGDNRFTRNYWPSVEIAANPLAVTNSATWEMKFMFDECDWPDPTPAGTLNSKLLYMMDATQDTANAFYVSGSGLGGASGSFNLAQNGFASGWEDRSYGWSDGLGGKSGVIYLDTGESFGPDGLWHTIKIEIDYLNGGATHFRMRMAIDGTWAYESNGRGNVDADGWFNMPPEMVIHGHRLMYADETAADGTTDTTAGNYAAGVQWDDLKLFSGIE